LAALRSRAATIRPVRALLDRLPWGVFVLLALTLGLAPFRPPHIVEKLQMLFLGTLVKPIDWFDLALHASPWLLLLLKAAVSFQR
jgi:hypothetical protein